MVEVTNTPWGRRVSYVLPCDPGADIQRIRFDKTMHVSPFFPLDMQYHWRGNTPGPGISVHLEQTIMKSLEDKRALARACLALAG